MLLLLCCPVPLSSEIAALIFHVMSKKQPLVPTVLALPQDEANGKHLGTWSPGFPELNVHQKSPIHVSNVQCSLFFMAQGIGKILEDQSSNLNPQDVLLQTMLRDTISEINMLAMCLRSVLGGECSLKPSPPAMPVHVFERKQWSHTLLKMARDYLVWLQKKIEVGIIKVNGRNNIKPKATQPKRLTYLEGSGYLL